MPIISIIIVNWNSEGYLRSCIGSIYNVATDGFQIGQIIVVDNASQDDSMVGLPIGNWPLVVIKNDANHGFAAACNQGAKVAKADYYLFLNPDTRLFQESLSAPIEFMEKGCNEHIGICGIKLVDKNQYFTGSCARFPSNRILFGRITGLNKCFPRLFSPTYYAECDLSEGGVVDQVIGAFFLMRASVFSRCCGFDERFFVYFEEVDLSFRAKQQGYISYYCPFVMAYHKGGGCSDRVKATRLFYSLRSRILYAKKHYSGISIAILIVLTGFELPLRLVQSGVNKSWDDARNTWSAYRQLLGYFLWRSQ